MAEAGLMGAGETVPVEAAGRSYALRVPTVFDLPKMRRSLTRQGVRRPLREEFRIAAMAGIAQLGEVTGDMAEADRQAAVLGRWYELLDPPQEDDLDEPDPVLRGEELKQKLEERAAEMAGLVAQVRAIEANLERHCPPYAELLADRTYHDELSQIEIVRLLLVAIDGEAVRRDGEGFMPARDYAALPEEAKQKLARKGMALLAPSETQRKN